ncbi:MAG: urease accessory protein UreD [Pseudomonadota bacterium]
MAEAVPRAQGEGLITVRQKAGKSVLSDLRMLGCLKVLFSRGGARLDAIVINSAGGLTSGDRITVDVGLEPGARASVTTQAAERAYRAADGTARVETRLIVAEGAEMFWLPQELILFDGAKLERRLTCDLAPGARALLVEPVIFGRALMGEALRDIRFVDRIAVDRAGVPLHRDATRLRGDMDDLLARSAVARGAGAMATLVYIAPDAAHHHAAIVPDLPAMAGASLLHDDVMVLRMLSPDGFALRQSLLPVLDRLTDNTLPTSWRL